MELDIAECLAIISTKYPESFVGVNIVHNGSAHEIHAAYICDAEKFLSLAIDTKVNATAILCDLVRPIMFLCMSCRVQNIFIQLVQLNIPIPSLNIIFCLAVRT